MARLVPVVVSILVIVAVALLQQRSKSLAAVAATMPITITLGLWIVFQANPEAPARAEFAGGLVFGILPTVMYLVAAWLAARSGWSFLATATAGYLSWAVSLALAFGLRRMFVP